MGIYKAKLLVIVTETSILEKVTKVVTELGADGYTVQHASGKGKRGARWITPLSEPGGNIRFEVLASEEVVKKIAEEMMEKFFKHYSGIAYIADSVDVYRVDKLQE